MFHLTFLGTGATVPSAERGVSALLVEQEARRFLVDCGEGTLRQIRAAHLGLRRLDRILFTHGHLDHILGLASLAGTLDLWGQGHRLCLHGGADALKTARILLDQVVWPHGHPGLAVDYVPLAPGCIQQQDGLRLSAFPVRHHDTDSFGFLFEEEPHRPLDPERMEALGITEGGQRQKLARGDSIRLPDGRRLDRDSVLGPPEPGARLAVIGDCESVSSLTEVVRGVDLLVIEATYRSADADLARQRGHLTIADATTLAREAGVRQLVLTHQSDRYDPDAVLAEARSLFPPVRIARDFDRIEVRAGA
ncbi:MBL fold metallo-hydrolase [Oleisolibacter albus]|uniref:MBL fold metallo-hydrolase n=1 Tax=Oleisolibacter albus TaxID=2171757 RepID=UPI000DF377F2|nr:MBL fold metallo-hydrolase [Oleisolibacter albus]